MKKIIALIILVTLHSLCANAQTDSSGIYTTADDFVAHKLSFAINCQTEKHKIYLNDFFNRPFITVKHFDTTYKIYRKDIYGYRFCNGEVYRIIKKSDLRILNAGEHILIYRHFAFHQSNDGKTNVTHFSFSNGAYAPVETLTFKNLEKAFPGNPKFYEQLHKLYKYNSELGVYNEEHKMYAINWIYKQSLEQTQ